MYFRIAAEVVLALFAVFGLYSAVRLFIQKFFGDRRLFVAVEILTREDAQSVEVLIREALGCYFLSASSRVAVFISEELSRDDAFLEEIALLGAECYIVND